MDKIYGQLTMANLEDKFCSWSVQNVSNPKYDHFLSTRRIKSCFPCPVFVEAVSIKKIVIDLGCEWAFGVGLTAQMSLF